MKKNKTIKITIITLLIVLLITFGKTFSKYIIEEFHSYYLNAKHFYFTSNRLTKNNPTYLINNWSGVGSFDISFDLLSEKNRYVYSSFDIPYEVTFTCPNDVVCSVNKPTGTIYNNSATHSDTVTLTVNPSRNYVENERLTIEILAKSTSPYVENLRATFEYVVGKQGVTYEIEDEPNQVYLLLKITNAINYCKVKEAFLNYSVNDLIPLNVYRTLSVENKSKCVSKIIDISFNPNVLLLDTTNDIANDNYTTTTIANVDYINSFSFVIEPVNTVAIKFYKKNVVNDYSYPIVNQNSIIGINIHD